MLVAPHTVTQVSPVLLACSQFGRSVKSAVLDLESASYLVNTQIVETQSGTPRFGKHTQK